MNQETKPDEMELLRKARLSGLAVVCTIIDRFSGSNDFEKLESDLVCMFGDSQVVSVCCDQLRRAFIK